MGLTTPGGSLTPPDAQTHLSSPEFPELEANRVTVIKLLTGEGLYVPENPNLSRKEQIQKALDLRSFRTASADETKTRPVVERTTLDGNIGPSTLSNTSPVLTINHPSSRPSRGSDVFSFGRKGGNIKRIEIDNGDNSVPKNPGELWTSPTGELFANVNETTNPVHLIIGGKAWRVPTNPDFRHPPGGGKTPSFVDICIPDGAVLSLGGQTAIRAESSPSEPGAYKLTLLDKATAERMRADPIDQATAEEEQRRFALNLMDTLEKEGLRIYPASNTRTDTTTGSAYRFTQNGTDPWEQLLQAVDTPRFKN